MKLVIAAKLLQCIIWQRVGSIHLKVLCGFSLLWIMVTCTSIAIIKIMCWNWLKCMHIRSGLISRIKKSLILSNIDILRFIRLILCYFMMGILKVVKFAICHHSLSPSLNIIHISLGEHLTTCTQEKTTSCYLIPNSPYNETCKSLYVFSIDWRFTALIIC